MALRVKRKPAGKCMRGGQLPSTFSGASFGAQCGRTAPMTCAIWLCLQLLSIACLIVVVLTHVAEHFQIFPLMGGDGPTAPDAISIL